MKARTDLVALIGRDLDLMPFGSVLKARSPKHRYVSPEVGNDYFFVEDAAREGGELLICENITDAISALQAGVACLSPVTVRFRKQDHDSSSDSRRGRADAEESGAGETGALESRRSLAWSGTRWGTASMSGEAWTSRSGGRLHPVCERRGLGGAVGP